MRLSSAKLGKLCHLRLMSESSGTMIEGRLML